MALAPEAAEGETYPSIFKAYVVRGAQVARATVADDAGLPPPEQREQALSVLSYALDLPDAWPDARDLLVTLAPKLEQAGMRDEWMPYLEQGIRQSEQLGDPAATARLHLELGILYQLRSQFSQAVEHFQAARTAFAALGDDVLQARATNRLAFVARLERRFAEADALLDAALALPGIDDRERGYALSVRGMVALDRGQLETAVAHYRASLAAWERSGDRRMIAFGLNNLGPTLRQLGRDQEAAATYRRAIDLFGEIGDPVHTGAALMNLGNVHLMAGQLDQALDLYWQAEPAFRQTQERLRLALVYANIAMANRKLQRWDEAERCYRLAIEYGQQVGDVVFLVDKTDGLALNFLQQGRLAEARAEFQRALALLAQIPNDPRHAELQRMLQQDLADLEQAGAAA